MEYAFNIKGEGFVLAQSYDVNASYKDLGAVCDAIRYTNTERAMVILERLIDMEMPIPYKKHNKYMGSRHELGGAKGAYPVKAAKEVMKTLANAMANARNKGLLDDDLVVVHASANKTVIMRRYPSKGSLSWGRGMYGRSSINHSDLEHAKIEIALSDKDSKGLTKNMRYFIRKNSKIERMNGDAKNQQKPKPQKLEMKKAAPKKAENKDKPSEKTSAKAEKAEMQKQVDEKK